MLVLLIQCTELIQQLRPFQARNNPRNLAKAYDWTQVAGIKQLVTMLVLQCSFMFFRFVLIAL